MGDLFPGKKLFMKLGQGKTWTSEKLDWKARVICRSCNNTWMSRIENDHAKPAMMDLIIGKLDFPILQSRANSIALFAFKTAVILDHANPKRDTHFFSRQVRHRFRKNLDVPDNVMMWMAGFRTFHLGSCSVYYPQQKLRGSVELYVCNYLVGHFALQVVAERKPSFWVLDPSSGYEHLAVRFWPRVPKGLRWPLKSVLKTPGEFRQFARRWSGFTAINPTGG